MTPAGTAPDLDARLARTLRDDIRAMQAYSVQDASGLIKLDAMENPFRLPEPLRLALGQRLAEVELNRYPGSRTELLRRTLADHVGLPAGYELMLGNGSDELISLLALACARPGAVVLAPQPGFVMYEVSAALQGLRFAGVPLTPDFELDLPAMLSAIRECTPALVYLAYPNNPTANLWDEAAVEQIIEAAPGFVVIDEAYQPFASRSWLPRLARHPQVLLMRTLSKFGLAGVRLGYLVGPRAVVAELDKARPPYNVSVLNTEAALFALEHEAEFAHQADVIKAERTRLLRELADLPGLRPFPSQANMILVRVPDADATFQGLRARGVLIKNVSRAHPLLANCVRLTVGLPQENDALLQGLRELACTPR